MTRILYGFLIIWHNIKNPLKGYIHMFMFVTMQTSLGEVRHTNVRLRELHFRMVRIEHFDFEKNDTQFQKFLIKTILSFLFESPNQSCQFSKPEL